MRRDETVSQMIIIKYVLLKQYVQFLSFSSLIFHFYQDSLCKPDTFLYVKQMQSEAVLSTANTFFKSEIRLMERFFATKGFYLIKTSEYIIHIFLLYFLWMFLRARK